MKALESEVDGQQPYKLSWQQLLLSFSNYYFMDAKALDSVFGIFLQNAINKVEFCSKCCLLLVNNTDFLW